MEFYTLKDAKKILNLFAPLLIGLSIEPPKDYIITSLEIQEYNDDTFRVVCRVADYAGVTMVADVSEVAKLHNHISPQEALDNLKK